MNENYLGFFRLAIFLEQTAIIVVFALIDCVLLYILGSGNKQPKIAAACVETLKMCLESFGHKVITLKSAFQVLPKLFHHRDKLVRAAVRDFFVEAHAWIGAIVKQQLEKEAKIEHW